MIDWNKKLYYKQKVDLLSEEDFSFVLGVIHSKDMQEKCFANPELGWVLDYVYDIALQNAIYERLENNN